MIQHFSTKILPRLMKQRTDRQKKNPHIISGEVKQVDFPGPYFYKNKETEWKYLRS